MRIYANEEKILLFWIEINKPQNNRPLVASRSSACIWCGKCNCRNNEDEDCYHLIIIHNFLRDLCAAIVHNCENLKRSFYVDFRGWVRTLSRICMTSCFHQTNTIHNSHRESTTKRQSNSSRIQWGSSNRATTSSRTYIESCIAIKTGWLLLIHSTMTSNPDGWTDAVKERERYSIELHLDMWKDA